MFWSIFQSGEKPVAEWDARDTPWFWSYLRSIHDTCVGVLQDWTLRDKDGNPPPKDIWFDRKALEEWRKDREAERLRDAGRNL